MSNQILELIKSKPPEVRKLLIEAIKNEIDKRRKNDLLTYIRSILQPKQLEFLEKVEDMNNPAKWMAMGGSRGGAKSNTIRNIMVYRRIKYPGSIGVLFRRSLNDLQDNHITPMFQEFPFLRKYYNVQQKTIKIPTIKELPDNDEKQVYSYIYFRHEEVEDKLIEMFQGKNYDDVFVDEATHNSERALIAMSNACRTTRSDMRSRFVLTMNPGGRSHSFIKRIFIDKKYIENEKRENYYYLQAYGWDNAYWSLPALLSDGLSISDYHSWDENQRFDYFVERSEYGRALNQLPDNERKAQLFGDWYVFAGQFFYTWSEKNILRGSYTPHPNYPKCGGLDYGKHTVLEVCERDYDGNIIFFAENYTVDMTASERAASIAEMLIAKELYNLRIIYDTDMEFSTEHYKGGDKAPIEIFREVISRKFEVAGLKGKEPVFSVVSKKPIDNKNYRIATNEFFKDFLGKNKILYVEHECPLAIQTIPELVYSKNDPSGLDFDPKIGFDHCYDASKMAIMELWTPVREKQELQWIKDWRKRTTATTLHGWKPGMG